jgi:hypothetical protein
MWEFNGNKEGESTMLDDVYSWLHAHGIAAVRNSLKRARFSFFVIKKWLKTNNNLKEC